MSTSIQRLGSVLLNLCLAVLPVTAIAQVDPGSQRPVDAPVTVEAAEADSIDDVSRLRLISRPGQSHIALRWSPSNTGGWLLARKFGYVLERAALNAPGDTSIMRYQTLTTGPIRPWPLEQFTREAVEQNNLLGVVGQALHGEYFESGMGTGSLRGILRAAKETQHRFLYSQLAADLDSTSARALGVSYTDRSVREGQDYIYRVYVAGIDSVVQTDTAYVVVTATDAGPIPAPAGFAAEPGDSTVTLSWEKDVVQRFSGYWIERSDDGGRTYERITEGPYFGIIGVTDPLISFTDRNVANYRVYNYRLRGISFFGPLSEPATVNVVPFDFAAPPPPFIKEVVQVGESRVQIKWDVVAEGMPDDFKGFLIGHSIEHRGDYTFDQSKLLPPSTREVFDDRILPTRSNYYIVMAVDTANNVSASLPMVAALTDTIPPAPPVNFEVVSIADSTGRIEIGWEIPDAPDLYAYRIYRKHNINDTWVLRNNDLHFDSTFVDTLNFKSLTNEVFYQVVAIDFSFNPSEPSEPFRVPLPDLLPPVTPVFTEAVPTDSSVSIAWSRSPSFDVVQQILYRRLSTENTWIQYRTFGAFTDNFTDYEVERLRTYEYTIQAADSSGFRSNLAVPVKGRVYDTGVRPGIIGLSAVADTSSGHVQLSWSYPAAEEGEYWFVVYRGLADEQPARYRSSGVETVFQDRRVRFRREEGYQYAVQVMYRNGGMSPLSDVVAVAYPRGD